MIKTLQSALAPLFIVGSFCCLSLFEYPLGQPRSYLSCLYILTVWSNMIYFIYYPLYLDQWQNKIIYFTELNKWISISSILISLYRFKELKICLHELSIINDTLKALGTPKEYQRLRNWIIRIIIGWIVYIFADLAANRYMDYTIYQDKTDYIRSCLSLCPDYVIILSTLICGSVLRYTSSRFHQVNNRLHILYSDLFENDADYRYGRQNKSILVRQRITKAKDHKQAIWIIMHVHLQLCLISHKLNKIFNIQILLSILRYFEEATILYIDIYMILLHDVNGGKLWDLVNVMNFLYECIDFIVQSILFLTLNYICQTIYCKINKTVAILHKLYSYNLDEDLCEQILQFILQIKQREVKFGMGLFHFGYNFTCQFYSAVLAFLIILIQMDIVSNVV